MSGVFANLHVALHFARSEGRVSPSVVHAHLGIAFIGFEVADDVSAFGLSSQAQREQQTGQTDVFLEIHVECNGMLED